MVSAGERAEATRSGGPDASIIFRYPVWMLGLLTAMAGALDVVEYREFGLFTANQGGNLILFWVRLDEGSALAWVIVASILGAMLGVALVVLLRMRIAYFAGPGGTRWLLMLSAIILGFTFLIATGSMSGQRLPALSEAAEYSGEWWLMVRLVTISALAMGVVGSSIVSVDGVSVSAIAPTGSFVTSTRLASARLMGERRGRTHFRSIVTIPISWTAGAAAAALAPVPRSVIVGLSIAIIMLVALSVRSPSRAPADE